MAKFHIVAIALPSKSSILITPKCGSIVSVATVLATARHKMVAAKMNVTMDTLIGVTRNRRADISPFVKTDSIDPHLGVIRIDDLDGNVIATIWNFAIHGT